MSNVEALVHMTASRALADIRFLPYLGYVTIAMVSLEPPAAYKRIEAPSYSRF